MPTSGCLHSHSVHVVQTYPPLLLYWAVHESAGTPHQLHHTEQENLPSKTADTASMNIISLKTFKPLRQTRSEVKLQNAI